MRQPNLCEKRYEIMQKIIWFKFYSKQLNWKRLFLIIYVIELKHKSYIILINVCFFPLLIHSCKKKYKIRYKILNPKGVDALKDSKEPQKIATAIVDSVHLDAELYRMGNTKAWLLLYNLFTIGFPLLCAVPNLTEKNYSCNRVRN